MNEKNKNEKTFGDLFSNINNEQEKKDNFMSFNDIKDNQKSEEEPVTMESLFNKSISSPEKNVESEIEPPKDPELKTLNNLAKTSSNIFETSEQKPEEEIKIPSISESNNKEIFNNLGEKEKQPDPTTPEKNPNNPNIFDFKSEQENIKQEDIKIPETNIDNSSSIFNKIVEPKVEQEQLDNENIFFSNDTPTNESTITSETLENKEKSEESPKEENKTSIFDTPKENNQEDTKEEIKSYPQINFEENNAKEENKEPEVNNNQNIFFDNNKTESSKEINQPNVQETPKPDSNDKNPFFEENNKPISSNPFFEEEKEPISSSPFFEDNETPKSTSPFFEEPQKQEEQLNPFFDNKINLDETKKHNLGTTSNKIDTSNAKKFDVKIVKKKEPLIKFLLGVVSYAIFILLLFIGITLLLYIADIKIRAAKGDYSAPKYNAYVVLTGSMLPEIQVYDVVITKKTEAKKLEKGDVITFASSDTRFLNTIITHRIMKKNYDAKTNTYTFQTKGDNNNVADTALVEENKIYGKVILKIPKLGYLQHFLAQDGGYILVVIVPCLIVISYDIVKLIKGLKRKKYKNIKVQK